MPRSTWFSQCIRYLLGLGHPNPSAAGELRVTNTERVDFDEYRRTQFPLEGLSVFDLTAALAILPAEAQVLRLDTRRDGWLFVETGRLSGMRAGCGSHFLLRRDAAGWVVAEVATWKA